MGRGASADNGRAATELDFGDTEGEGDEWVGIRRE